MATIKDLKRMCDSYKKCSDCPLNDTCCGDSVSALPDNADEIVDKWALEHPIKTYMQDFLRNFRMQQEEKKELQIFAHIIYILK